MTAKKKEVTPAASTPEAEEETIPGTHSTARLSIWIAVVIIAIALIGYLTTRGSFRAEDVAAGISGVTEDIAGYLGGNGYEGEFSYASLALQGNIFSRVAVVQQPQFTLRNTTTGEEMRITTDYVTIDPTGAAMDSFALVMEKPVTVERSDAEYRIVQKLPVTLVIRRGEGEEKKSLQYATEYPEGMSFIVQVSGREEGREDASYQLHLGAGSTGKGVLDLTENSYYEESNLQDAALELSQSIVKAKSLQMVFEEAGHDDERFRHYKVNGAEMSFVGPHQALGSLETALEIEEKLPQHPGEQNREISLNELSVKGEDFTLTGTGEMELHPDEILPYGKLDAEIASLDALLARLGKADILPESSVPLIAGVLDRAATPGEDPNVAQLHFKRTPGGAFLIGDQTFEELAISLLRDMVSGGASAAAPQPAPSSDAQPGTGATDEAAPEEEEIAPVKDMPDTSEPEASAAPEEAPAADDDAVAKAREALEQLKREVMPQTGSMPVETPVETPEVAPGSDAAPKVEGIAPPSEDVKPAEDSSIPADRKANE